MVFVFTGVVLVSDPFTEDQDAKIYEYQGWGYFFAILGAITSALAMIFIRKLGGKVDTLLMTTYWALANALISPLNLSLKVVNQDETTIYTWFDFFCIELNLVSMFVYMQLQTLAYVTDKAVRIAPVATFVLVLNCTVDILVLGSSPGIMQILGALLIIGSNFGLSMLKCYGII